ncbi:MAG: DUF1638 domain-containing protein [Rhodospirillales bacterium]
MAHAAPHADAPRPPKGAGQSAIAPQPPPPTLLIACGALAREIVWLTKANGWRHLTVACLPAHYHNTPSLIPGAVRRKIRGARGRFERILVLYGDCGTGGELDTVLAEEEIERVAGPHCYAFFAGLPEFDALHAQEPGTFYLTDYLARHFDRLIVAGLGIDRHPELLNDYFGNYKRLVYLAQTDDAALTRKARGAAQRLGLAFERRFTGFGDLAAFLDKAASTTEQGHGVADHRVLA